MSINLYIATENKNKLKEVRDILAPVGVNVMIHPEYSSLHVEETGSTFIENARLKALALSRLTGDFVIADDSGLCVDCLDGAPGIYSARFAGEHSTDKDNNDLLLKKLKDCGDRRAQFVCAISLAWRGEIVADFEGVLEGSIGLFPQGESGFGYDPLFVLTDGRVVACLPPEVKNSLSHRKLALDKLAEYFNNMS